LIIYSVPTVRSARHLPPRGKTGMEPDLSMAPQAAMAAESDRYIEIYDNQTARQKTLHHFITIYNKQLTTNVRTYWKENRNDFRLQCRG
jgi:hypothetical protein